MGGTHGVGRLGYWGAHGLAGLGFNPAASDFQPLFHFLLSSLPDSDGWPVLLWETGKSLPFILILFASSQPWFSSSVVASGSIPHLEILPILLPGAIHTPHTHIHTQVSLRNSSGCPETL